jgi:single-strand DNA-binding protein
MKNSCSLIGRVGKEPEIKHLQSGDIVANFSLAVSEHYRNKDGEKVETTEWFAIVVWKKRAEIVEKYVHKGDLLDIEGKIVTRSWEDKEGIKRYTTEIICNELIMLGKKSTSDKPEIDKAEKSDQPEEIRAANDNGETDDLPF